MSKEFKGTFQAPPGRDEEDLRAFERMRAGTQTEEERSAPTLKQLVEAEREPAKVPPELIDKMEKAGGELYACLSREEAEMIEKRIEGIERISKEWHDWMMFEASEHPSAYLLEGASNKNVDPQEARIVVQMLKDPNSSPPTSPRAT